MKLVVFVVLLPEPSVTLVMLALMTPVASATSVYAKLVLWVTATSVSTIQERHCHVHLRVATHELIVSTLATLPSASAHPALLAMVQFVLKSISPTVFHLCYKQQSSSNKRTCQTSGASIR